jgi:hypothetical protein
MRGTGPAARSERLMTPTARSATSMSRSGFVRVRTCEVVAHLCGGDARNEPAQKTPLVTW